MTTRKQRQKQACWLPPVVVATRPSLRMTLHNNGSLRLENARTGWHFWPLSNVHYSGLLLVVESGGFDVVLVGREIWRGEAGGVHGGADDGAGHDDGGDGSDCGDVGVAGAEAGGAGGHGEDGVSVAHGVDGVDGASVAVVGHLGDFGHLDFGEWSVGGYAADGGVGGGLDDDAVAVEHGGHGVAEAFAVFAARSGDDVAVHWVDYVADSVDGYDGSDDDAGVPDFDAGGAEAGLHGEVRAEHLADGGSGACAYVAFLDGAGFGGEAGVVAVFFGGANLEVADAEVHEDGCRNDGDDAEFADPVARVFLFEIAHDSGGGAEAVGGASGEDDGVDFVDLVGGSEEVGLAGAGGGAADVDSGGGSGFAEDDGAAGGAVLAGLLADLDAGDVGDGASGGHGGVVEGGGIGHGRDGSGEREAEEGAGEITAFH